MKKRVLGLILMSVMALTFVPATVFAADFTGWTELDNTTTKLTGGKYYLKNDLTLSSTLLIYGLNQDSTVMLDLNGHILKMTGSGPVIQVENGKFTLQDSASNTTHTGKFADCKGGIITGGEHELGSALYCRYGDTGVVISGGTFDGSVYLRGDIDTTKIDGGVFNGTVTNRASIESGTFNGQVNNEGFFYYPGVIKGGTFNGAVVNGIYGTIENGIFHGEVRNTHEDRSDPEYNGFHGIIKGGTFTESSEVINSGEITGGTFRGTVTIDRDGSIADSAKVTVTFRSDGEAAVKEQQVLKGQRAVRPATPIKDGYLFIGWYNGSTLHNFNTPITANTTLTAGWFDPATVGGVTPQLKIGEDNLWYVSYDNGATWVSLGVKATGDTGATGEKGDKGDTGATGPQGEKGEKGDKGDTGATGEKGDKGDTGATGPQGEKGEKGDKGDTGATGEKGDKGDTGATGPQGEKGEKGDKGDTGATGEKGDKGDTGAAGKDGVTPLFRVNLETNKWEISYDNGVTWTAYAQATGDKGDKGDQGDKGDKGDPGLIPYIGVNGNWWLGATDTGVAAAGPKGDKGDTGATGATGPTGATGATGAAGAAGRDGRDGLNGQDGVDIVSAEINADGHLILTYTNGETTDLGVVVGADGLTPFIGDNGNWWIGELDTGVRAAASSPAASTATIVIGAAAGLALAGNIALALTLRSVLKKKELV